MAACKKKKQIKQCMAPGGKSISNIHELGGKSISNIHELGGKQSNYICNPEQYYSQHPSWRFFTSDLECWSFDQEHIGERIWSEILPRLQALETQTWSEILIRDKKQNHAIKVTALNKVAQERLANRQIEADSIISLRLTGKHRLYGYILDHTFHILWYDDDHGDNASCVCRSKLKHT